MKHPLFESMVMVMIVVNCVLLAMDDSYVIPGSVLANTIVVTDYIFAAFFFSEMTMKLIAWGIWNCGPGYVYSVAQCMREHVVWLEECLGLCHFASIVPTLRNKNTHADTAAPARHRPSCVTCCVDCVCVDCVCMCVTCCVDCVCVACCVDFA